MKKMNRQIIFVRTYPKPGSKVLIDNIFLNIENKKD